VRAYQRRGARDQGPQTRDQQHGPGHVSSLCFGLFFVVCVYFSPNNVLYVMLCRLQSSPDCLEEAALNEKAAALYSVVM